MTAVEASFDGRSLFDAHSAYPPTYAGDSSDEEPQEDENAASKDRLTCVMLFFQFAK